MKTIYHTFDAIDFDLGFESIELEINYSISPYRAATWHDPEEGGEIEDCEIKVLLIDDLEPTDEQAKKIMDEIDGKEFNELIGEWCFEDYKESKEQDKIDWAEYKWDMRNDR